MASTCVSPSWPMTRRATTVRRTARRPSVTSVLNLRFFFFQAEDGIRDVAVTGVQTCALPIYERDRRTALQLRVHDDSKPAGPMHGAQHSSPLAGRAERQLEMKPLFFLEVLNDQIGRASCRERV